MRLKANSILMIIFLGSLAATAPLSIDIGLPGFATTAAALGIPIDLMPQTLSVFLIGFSVGPLILGPMADHFGRRPVLIAGLSIFILGGLGSALAFSFHLMLVSRLIQGIGAGVAATLPFAIARDIYQGDEARVRMSAITLVLGLGPIIAPILGAVALSLTGWRSAYALLAITGTLSLVVAIAWLQESAPARNEPMTSRSVIGNYRTVLMNPIFLGNALINACSFGVMFAYIAGSPEVLMIEFGLSSVDYSLSFALSAGALMCGSFVSGKLAQRSVPSDPIALIANVVIAATTVVLTCLALTHLLTATSFITSIALTLFGVGLLTPNVIHDALLPMGKIAGIATAVLRGIQMAFAGCASAIVGSLHIGGIALTTAGVMTGFAAASVAFQWWMARHKTVLAP
nr:multidrug effflux MFS transporter [uncultured Pseudomonas sp.]